jgi:DNA excision repair protein ERCC-4
LAIGNDEIITTESAACIDDLTPQDLLLSLPGINSNNFRAVMNNVTDIAQLSQMSVQQLTPLIGPINAKKLATFFKQTL